MTPSESPSVAPDQQQQQQQQQQTPEPPQEDLQGHYIGPASGVSFLLRVQKRLHQAISFSVPSNSIFTFGDAAFGGSMGATPLNRPVVGMVRYGNGYLMVGSDGGIFTFSDLGFVGSLGATPPVAPITSVAVV